MLDKLVNKGLKVTGKVLKLIEVSRKNNINYWYRDILGFDKTTNTIMCVEDYLKVLKDVEAE